MSEQPDLHPEASAGPADRPLSARPSTAPSSHDLRIEDYLDHVCAPLVGLVPYARRQELRAELRGHLEALAATHEELGSARDAAVVIALRQFGPPRDLSRQWAREWVLGSSPGPVQPAWRAMGVALGSFGLATLLGLACIGPITGSAISESVRWPFFLTALYLLPLAAGLGTGLVAPARHVLGTFYALALILSLVTLAFGTGPDAFDSSSLAGQGLELVFIQLFCWVPIGCAAAAVGGSLRGRLVLRPHRWVLQ